MSDRTIAAADDSANPPNAGALFRTIAESFTGVYLTMLSIIQGVALTDLANITFSERVHFTVVNWLEVATMLWTLIYVWNHFMGDALMTHWIPDLEDAALLFGTGVFELVANHAIVWGITPWIATLSTMFFAWSLGEFYVRRQEERVVRDPFLMEMLNARMRRLLLQSVAGGAVVGALAVASYLVPGNGTVALLGVTITLVVSLLIGAISAGFWRRVRRYALSGKAA
ncbi:MAG TPA: hypothetical protein VE591_10020 [Candidatus Acidoferrum sp.]|jgi:hypothetical protein|nr:hypothetical protein [Candidatus Acidoferrum sp.]